jgi:hypothetical protein
MDAICEPYGITRRTGCNWLRQRDNIGSLAYHHIRKRSKALGRRSRVSKETCKMLVSLSRNPVRDQRLEAQIEYHTSAKARSTYGRASWPTSLVRSGSRLQSIPLASYARTTRWKKNSHSRSSHYIRSVSMKSASGSSSPNKDISSYNLSTRRCNNGSFIEHRNSTSLSKTIKRCS